MRSPTILFMILLLPMSFVAAISFGAIPISFSDTFSALTSALARISLFDSTLYENKSLNDVTRAELVLAQIRIPRAILAALVGALLGICGATSQGLFRNPLADPSLIGVTAGASAGAAITIFFAANLAALEGLTGIGMISMGAFIGGGLAVVLVYKLATSNSGTSVATMLLAGIAITAIAAGLVSLIEFFANNEMLRRISLWRMGGLDGANYDRVLVAGIGAVIIIGLLPRFSTALNALLLGESEARHLGIAVQKVKAQIIVLIALGVATSVALAGTIAFVGLVVPHIMRLLCGPNHKILLPMSALGGAILLLLSDTLARTLFAPIELPVGLVTAFLGAPFFISLLRRRHDFGMN